MSHDHAGREARLHSPDLETLRARVAAIRAERDASRDELHARVAALVAPPPRRDLWIQWLAYGLAGVGALAAVALSLPAPAPEAGADPRPEPAAAVAHAEPPRVDPAGDAPDRTPPAAAEVADVEPDVVAGDPALAADDARPRARARRRARAPRAHQPARRPAAAAPSLAEALADDGSDRVLSDAFLREAGRH